MSSCCVVGCLNRKNRISGSNLKFYRIPADTPFQKKRRQLWLNAIRRTDWTETTIGNSRVCSAHFVSGKKSEDPSSPDYVPTIFQIPKTSVRRPSRGTLKNNDARLGIKKIKMQQLSGSKSAIAAFTLSAGTTDPTLVEAKEGTDPGASICDYIDDDVMYQIDIKSEPIDSFHPACQSQESDTFVLKDKIDFKSEPIDSFQVDCRLQQNDTFVLKDKIDFKSEPIDSFEPQCPLLQCDMFGLKEKLNLKLLAQESFENKDKLKTFTGLHNYQVLMAIVDLVKPALQDTRHLTSFQQLLLTLMRLKVNLPVSFLSHLFGIHSSTIFSVFSNVINVLNEVLLPVCVSWPKASSPAVIRKSFKRCVPIIDCFEISLDKSEDLDAQTHPRYRSYFTMKYLTGITPKGVISFVSKGWGGSTTDAHMIENCGVLDHLLSGDLILTGRDLTVQNIGLHCAKVVTHGGIKQLGKVELEHTGRLAEARMHVEKVTGQARSKYRMLHGPVPISHLRIDDMGFTTLDKIVRVVCALTNLCPSDCGNHLGIVFKYPSL